MKEHNNLHEKAKAIVMKNCLLFEFNQFQMTKMLFSTELKLTLNNAQCQ